MMSTPVAPIRALEPPDPSGGPRPLLRMDLPAGGQLGCVGGAVGYRLAPLHWPRHLLVAAPPGHLPRRGAGGSSVRLFDPAHDLFPIGGGKAWEKCRGANLGFPRTAWRLRFGLGRVGDAGFCSV